MPNRWRLPVVLVLYLLLGASLALPHLGVAGTGFGRSLIPTGMFFSQVQVSVFGPGLDVGLLGLAINVAYLGIGLHQLGLLLTVPSLWVFATEDINKWIYRIVVVGGWLLAGSVPILLIGWLLIRSSGAPALLGWAWLPTLLAGLAIIIIGRRSRERVDRSWYVTRPELQ